MRITRFDPPERVLSQRPGRLATRAGRARAQQVATALAAGMLLAVTPAALLARSDPGPDDASSYARETFQIPRAAAAVRIDGVLDEPLWQGALTVDLAYEITPGENTPAPVATACLLAYDESNLYVAFDARDADPSQIKARLCDRDDIQHDDRVGIVIDTFNDERRGFEFLANPLGVQMDATRNDVGGNSDSDLSWDAIWQSAGAIHEGGYAVEMAIPFTSLRFPRTKGPQTWGFAAFRSYPRNVQYEFMSSPRDRDASCFFCQTSKLAGLEGIAPGNSLELAPTFTTSRNDQPGEDGSLKAGEARNDVGLSMRWGITPNVSLNATFNPDFSQVEADAAQLNVNNRFALFFPEKRPFFLEGADFFQTPLNVMYTRTVVDPSWGFKTTGKEGDNAFGAFVARDASPNLLFPSNQSSRLVTHDDEVTTGVFRYRRDVGDGSTIGLMATDREGAGYHNRVYGADGFLRLTATNMARVQLLGSATRYPEAVADGAGQEHGELSGHGASAIFVHESRGWNGWAVYEDLARDFRADAGFIPRVDTRHVETGLRHRFWSDDGGWFTRLELGVEGSQTGNHDGRLTDRGGVVSARYFGPMQSFLDLRYGRERNYYAGTDYDLDYVFWSSQITPSKNVRAWCTGSYGDAVDFANGRPAKRLWGGPGFQYAIGQHLTLFLDHTYEQVSVDDQRLFLANLVNMNLAYQFSSRMVASAVMQYLDISRNTSLYAFDVNADDSDLFTQLLFSYKVNPQTLLYLGYSDSRYGAELEDVRQVDRTLFAKVGYAWVR